MVSGLFSPILGKIDAEGVGGRTRSMRIAADYGKRLDVTAKNMQPDAIKKLAQTYSSHSFVIDKAEASALFRNVRDADALELELANSLGRCARWHIPTQNNEPIIECLSATQSQNQGEVLDANGDQARSEEGDGANPPGAGQPSDSDAGGLNSAKEEDLLHRIFDEIRGVERPRGSKLSG